MEQEEDSLSMPPFWASNDEFDHRHRRRLRRSSSLLLTSASLLVLFLVIALVLTLVVVPTLHSFASNILRPHTVKNSWDSLNLVLVLFAIVCGFLSKNNTNTETQTQTQTQTPRSHYQDHRRFSNPSTPPPWYQYSHYSDSDRSLNRLRSFNSYPDLRQHVAADERLRFYDDTHLLHRHRQPRSQDEHEEEMSIENVATAPPQIQAVRRNVKRGYQVETIEKQETNNLIAENSQSPPQSPPSPSPEPSLFTRTNAVGRNAKRSYQVEAIEKPDSNDLGADNSQPSLSPPQSPKSPPLKSRTKPVRRNAKRTYQKEPIEKKAEKNDLVVKSSQPPPLPAEGDIVHGMKRRGITTKEFLTSLRGKKKKQRQRSVENFDSIINSEPLTSQPPPSPPPPPPHSVFQNLFSSKKGKHKKRHFVSVATTTRVSNKREQSSYSLEEDNVMIIGNESPLIPIPPPPPPPPFKLPAWKFRVQGDFVRVDSIGSSRSGSPDLDEVNVDSPTISTEDETSQCNSPFAPDDEDPATVTAASLFCPSPDVDTKAHNFIQTFRAGLRMDKMNSMKEKQGIGRSNLGPSPNSQTINGTRPS